MQIDETFIFSHLRTYDRHRYLASLLCDGSVRLHICVLYAFHAEISRISKSIREPLTGEIRLQWWREVTAENARKSEAIASPLAHSLNQLIDEFNISRASFDGYCRSRIFDFYNDPMPDKNTYEGYCGETASTLLQWVCQIIDAQQAKYCSQACGYAGIAQSIADHLCLLMRHRVHRQLYIPLEILTDSNLDCTDFLAGDKDNIGRKAGNRLNFNKTILDFVEYGRIYLEKARLAVDNLPPDIKQAFLPLASSARIFSRAEKLGEKCLYISPTPAMWKRQMDLWQCARKGTF